jgi:RND family efflux transporter MFP subunit
MIDRRKLLAPVAVLIAAVLGAVALLVTSPPVATTIPERALPAVRVIDALPRTVQLTVHSEGTVAPRTESELIPQISGPVVWISPALASGGFFEEGEPLLRVDRRDYEAAVTRYRAVVARAGSEHEHARTNLARRERLSASDISSGSQLDDARRGARVSEATLAEAHASLDQAQRDLVRTELLAPFTGRVREARVDLGQFVSRGVPIATLYATDFVEVRLPIPDPELAYLDLRLWEPGRAESEGPAVTLRATFAGAEHEWQGRIVRSEGEIDAKSRMVHVVARVADPYAVGESGRPPLAVGLFVRAEIAGSRAEAVTVVPRSALRDDRQLMVVDADDRLWLREVDLLRIEREEVLLRNVLAPGERVCTSPLQAVVDGMRVRPLADAGTSPDEAAPARDSS